MPSTEQEQDNLRLVTSALDVAARDFKRFGEQLFAEDIKWTITGHGPVARTFHGVEDLINNAEQAMFDRWAAPAAVTTKGVWAVGNKVFTHITSSTTARDGLPYRNEYLYILTMKAGKAVAGTAWLDLHAYYDIVARVDPGA
ncbi:MAG: nuclear transport factor 2 family protein [Gluconacetobacter diazotrophicus]|nr:nuclear transport factor 2 family protein [Gluconacetobacter diazotrophicus]